MSFGQHEAVITRIRRVVQVRPEVCPSQDGDQIGRGSGGCRMTGASGIGRSHGIDAKLTGEDSRITIRARHLGLTSKWSVWLTVPKRADVSVQSLHYP